jgi:hypothetical protein
LTHPSYHSTPVSYDLWRSISSVQCMLVLWTKSTQFLITLSRFTVFQSQARLHVYYQITQLSEQKYIPAVSFAEHNFGPFERIFFVIVLFESLSKRYVECYFRICIFKFASFITVFPFLVWLWDNPNRKCNFKMSKQRITLYRITLEMPEIDSTGQTVKVDL